MDFHPTSLVSLIQLQPWELALLTAVAFVVAYVGGVVGLVLGTLRLPAILMVGYSAPVAAGTNVTLSALAALSGSAVHLRSGRVDLKVVGVMGIPSVIGGFLGGYFGGRVPESALLILIAVLVAWGGVSILQNERLSKRSQKRQNPHPPNLQKTLSPMARYSIEGILGLGIGLLGGAVGLILGTLRIPAMLRLGIDPRIAAGTNLTIGFIMGTSGFLGHLVHGEVDWRILIPMGVASVVGAYLGAKHTGRMSVRSVRLMIGSVLCIVALAMVPQIVSRWGQ